MNKRYLWPVLVVVFVVTLAVGSLSGSSSAPRTQQQRVDNLASQIRCPTCNGLSVLQSDAPLAESAKQEIISEVGAGRSDAQVKQYFVTRYGDTALMTPKRSGFTWTAWVLPAVIGLVLLAGVVLAIRKWGSSGKSSGPTPEERKRVEMALGQQ